MDFEGVRFDIFAIEGPAEPVDQIVMVFMGSIVHCLKEHFKTRNAADIFGWRTPLTLPELRQT